MHTWTDPIDVLVHQNGNYQILFKYNNFGNPLMFLLPNFLSDDEELKNMAIASIIEWDYEGIAVIENFMRSRPKTPFVVMGNGILDCVNIMNQKLKDVNYEICSKEFLEEATQFEIFQKACLKIVENSDEHLFTACYDTKYWYKLGIS